MKKRWAWLLFLLPAVVAWPVPTQAEDITYVWDACDTGSPALDYRMEVEIDGTVADSFLIDSAAPLHAIAVSGDRVVRVRVAGVDSRDRQGVWSAWSEAYAADDGPPGWGVVCVPWRQ